MRKKVSVFLLAFLLIGILVTPVSGTGYDPVASCFPTEDPAVLVCLYRRMYLPLLQKDR